MTISTVADNPLLELVAVSRHFAGVKAVDEVSFSVSRGEVHGLIGPNGSGKTTLLNLISGSLRLSSGGLSLNGRSIARDPAYQRARGGIARSFQLPTNFAEMSALHNVMIALFAFHRGSSVGEFFGLPRDRREVARLVDRAQGALETMGISNVRDELAGSLPLGYQRWLGMAIAVAIEPSLLLLDEPLGGMNAGERRSTMDKVLHLRDAGVTVLLVEHDVKAVLGSCDVVTVINAGKKIAEGNGYAIRNDPAVIDAYLGVEVE